jgi:hypothetical protein
VVRGRLPAPAPQTPAVWQTGIRRKKPGLPGRALNDLKGAQGTFSQAGPQSVAIKVGDHAGFAIYYLQCALGTGRHTVAASVTEFFVNFDNLTYGFHMSLLFMFFLIWD